MVQTLVGKQAATHTGLLNAEEDNADGGVTSGEDRRRKLLATWSGEEGAGHVGVRGR